ncbi:MAG TPA: hypothetical protein VFN55_18275 [Solirubrobacteraceae bacterium]|nr:hypothetical protein [Solirubrobacteraceae bacterium]
MRSGLGTLLWIVVGVYFASNHHYLNHTDTIKRIVSLLLAVILWPLLLLGINLHVR